MANRLYVGNLPYQVTDVHLREAFAPHGEVVSTSVVMDRATGRSRGFGFVEMATADQASKATAAMDGALLEGRPLTVNEARERTPRTGGAGGPRSFTGDRPGSYRGDNGGGGGDRGAPAPAGDRGAGAWDGGAPARGSDKRRERDRSDREDGGRGGRGGGGRGGW